LGYRQLVSPAHGFAPATPVLVTAANVRGVLSTPAELWPDCSGWMLTTRLPCCLI